MINNVYLKDIANISAGSSAPKNEFLGEKGIPFIRAGNLEELINGADVDTLAKVKKEYPDILKLKKASVDSILFAKSGMSSMKNRIYKLEKESYFVNHLACITAKDKNVNVDYLKYFFEWFKPSTLIRDESYPSIRLSDISNIKINLPSKKVQEKVATALSEVDNVLKLRQQQIEALSALKQSVFFDMFGDPNSTDCKFAKKRIGEVFEVQTGKTPSRKRIDYWDKEEVPWIKTTEVQNVEINTNGEFITKLAMEENKLKLFPVDTILIAMYGQGKTRGQSGILKFPATCNQACAALLPSEEMEMKFVWNQLLILYDNLRALGRGGNQPNLNLSLVRGFEIIVPPNGIQKKYADKVNKIDESIQKIKNSLEQLTILYDSLLHKAFNGELFKEEIKA